MSARADEFPFDAEIALLNHASFGIPTKRMLDLAERTRRRIERDAAGFLADSLLDELRTQATAAANFLAAPPDGLALTLNVTEASAAVATSWCHRAGIRVAMLDTEYPSVIRGWQVAADRAGGSVQLLRLELPVSSPDEVVRAFDEQISGRIDLVVLSLITSSTALLLPVRRIAEWAAGRGAVTVVDAAHAAGHIELDVTQFGVPIVFGALHKWLPVPRSLGFLYAATEFRDTLRPAGVAIGWDDGFLERFAWRGTWDPAPALCLSAALDEEREWRAAGLLESAERMADHLAGQLQDCGLQPTGADAMLPPRLRAFLVPDPSVERLRNKLAHARVRAWAGAAPSGHTLLRASTHVFTTEEHVRRLVEAVTSAG